MRSAAGIYRAGGRAGDAHRDPAGSTTTAVPSTFGAQGASAVPRQVASTRTVSPTFNEVRQP